jgi:hypothetical protein
MRVAGGGHGAAAVLFAAGIAARRDATHKAIVRRGSSPDTGNSKWVPEIYRRVRRPAYS